jgi:dienelactone hydrolase
MAEVVLFHHAQGLTTGVGEFAETLRRAGHIAHVPDLYQGRVFATLADGIGYAQETGIDTIIERGRAAAGQLPGELVYAGFSLGVPPAQMLAQTRPGARGALLFEACLPVSMFGGAWPQGVPVQVHGMDADEFFAGKATWTPPARLSRRPRTPSCSSTPATGTCSPTRACRPTTSRRPRCSPSACSASSMASTSCPG